MTSGRYDPVPLDVEATHKRWMKQPGYAAAYAALEMDSPRWTNCCARTGQRARCNEKAHPVKDGLNR